MSLYFWAAAAGVALFIGFVVFCLRQGLGVKPDPNRKVEDWPKITQGGSGS
jgi:hypothetical protein